MNSHILMRCTATGFHRCRLANDPKLDWNPGKTQCWFKNEKDKAVYDVTFTTKTEGERIKRIENEKLKVAK